MVSSRNKRKDRQLLIKQIVKDCRGAAKDRRPLSIRTPAIECLGQKGLTSHETKEVYAPLLEEVSICCIDLTPGVQGRVYYNIPPYRPCEPISCSCLRK